MTTTGATAAAAAFLAACGSDSDDGGSGGSSSGGSGSNSLIYKPTDTGSQAKAGGTLRHYANADISHFDAVAANTASTVNFGSVFAYNRLLKFKSGKHPGVADGSSEGEMAESWEISPDKLTVTMKLRRGRTVKWDDRAPTNGREMDIDDVLFSYNKFAELNPSGPNIANKRNPQAPVDSVTASDPNTLVIKLVRPDATIIGLFSATDHLYIMPKESESAFDPRTEVRGNGPWQLQEYTPSSRFVWKKNPNYYIANRPFPDIIERPIITEVSQQQAQFRAGNIITDVVTNLQEEVLNLKGDVPQANLFLPQTYPNGLTPSIWFGYEGDSPFKDMRARQAVSMMIDREGFNSAINNSDAFERAGLGKEVKYNSPITAGWGPFWLDPKSKDFGDNAKYLQLNLEEAKKLVSAAGFPNGFSTEVFFNQELTYGPAYAKSVEVLTGMITGAGNQVKQSGFPYTQYFNSYYAGYKSGASAQGGGGTAKGYNGYTVQAERPYANAVLLMLSGWHSKGGSYHGLSPTGNDAFSGDPKLDDMIQKVQGEFDTQKQISMTHDVIRYMTGQSYFVPNPVSSPNYQLWWPAVSNLGMKERWPNNALWTEEAIDWWIDTTKAPFA